MSSTPLIGPVYDEDVRQAIKNTIRGLEVAYKTPADGQMEEVARVQVEFVIRNIRTPESLYDPISGHGYMSNRVKNLTSTVAAWLNYDYRGKVVDDGFLRRLWHLRQLAEMEPQAQAS